MKITSFDTTGNNILRDPKQDYLFDLFQKNIVFTRNIVLIPYIVPREFEMRLDRISNYIFSSPDYVEELMVINDIINPYSVKEGQVLYYCTVDSVTYLYTKDELLNNNEEQRQSLINSSQPNRQKQKLNSNQNLPVTVKSSNLQQIKVTNDNKVQIINSFQ